MGTRQRPNQNDHIAIDGFGVDRDLQIREGAQVVQGEAPDVFGAVLRLGQGDVVADKIGRVTGGHGALVMRVPGRHQAVGHRQIGWDSRVGAVSRGIWATDCRSGWVWSIHGAHLGFPRARSFGQPIMPIAYAGKRIDHQSKDCSICDHLTASRPNRHPVPVSKASRSSAPARP